MSSRYRVIKAIAHSQSTSGGLQLAVALSCLFASSQQVSARVIHVANTGVDTNPGTNEAPMHSIGLALIRAKPGDTVRIHPGTYRERIAPEVSGEPKRPITVRGQRDQDGKWLTHIDGTVPFRGPWEPAPEIGTGVYRAKQPGFEPHHMQIAGRFIPRVWPNLMRDGTGFEKLAYAARHTEKTTYLQADVAFWDTPGAAFGCSDGTVYLRFRDGRDPASEQIAAAPADGGIHIENQSCLVFRDLAVHGGEICVCIQGPNATDNVIEHCRLTNGNQRVFITDSAARNCIRHNEITIDFYSDTCRTGAWGCGRTGDDVPYELRLKEHFYNLYKHVFGPHSTSDYGVRIVNAGPDNTVFANHVFGGGQGISVYGAEDTSIYRNTVHGFSSLGLICTLNRVVNARLFDNVVYDCNINLRIHHVNEPRQSEPRSLYVYRNRFWQKPGVGTHIYFHYWKENDADPYLHPDIFIYHNSFAGGLSGLSVSGYADECGGLPRCVVVNNVLSSGMNLRVSMPFIANDGMFRFFDCNWLGGHFNPDSFDIEIVNQRLRSMHV